ncbi:MULTISPECIES: Spo0B domain-containing protein [Bacillales]|uniref:Sporulation protein n=1 Tax=Brevibacillus aydinogluensis TaxID=927786 RepID=A0AA48MA06_9BACL|nr:MULTISPECIES: Spo0B domain-containing protein [Bacillales]REK64511.1 MAG: sporulation protein [Brevibacillus sp.]MBR8660600.1 Spo0B domain-containing protein [Brevibacillus sp. NL20B1]MDT3414380.1 stage 0 sporulation protein B (sporulation initiation phosphotransferase) [Brevibacillus aydinogluensis]NNV02604.1 sporulation protein [Brevibacillus sp. MCWH]UFJ59968.1 Spo0B domain-containing protein [Anoxybacillus sediminis]
MRDERTLFTQQTDQLLAVLNRQRHDWLNHVQVLLGYLRLGRLEEGEKYLKRIAELAMQESMVARLNSSLLSVFFLTFNALNNDLLLEVDVCSEVDLRKAAADEHDLFQLVAGIVFTVGEHLDRNEFEPASMQISLYRGEKGIHFRFDLAGKLRASAQCELEKLVRDKSRIPVIITACIHTDEEWVLETAVPVAE